MTNTETPTPGQLFQLCLEQATIFPANHDQSRWIDFDSINVCGTTGCLAGHAVLLGNPDAGLVLTEDWLRAHGSDHVVEVFVRNETGEEQVSDIMDMAAELLNLDVEDAEYAFYGERTLAELWEFGARYFPGEVAFPSDERMAEIREAGPLLVSRVKDVLWWDQTTESSGVVSRDFPLT